MPKKIWFLSTEPEDYPWERLQKEKRVRWDGIRGTAARKWLRDFSKGDIVVCYHSSPLRSVWGSARVASPAAPDPKDENWLVVDLENARPYSRAVPLSEMRDSRALRQMKFLRMPRLSVSPVTQREHKTIRCMVHEKKKKKRD